MKCLITGINGFAASHLADHLLELGHEVYGTVRIRPNTSNIDHLKEKIKLRIMDLHDPYAVDAVIHEIKPDAVFHLAAQSFVGISWQSPMETFETNILGTVHILEAVKSHCRNAKVHIASSSQVYGSIPFAEQPMGLRTRFNPMNPYDSSKLSQDMIALQYYNSYKLNIIRTRAFNISGPRRGQSFAESSWAKQIAQFEKTIIGEGNFHYIKHGNLESFRDYIDVRDVVKAYAKACFFGEAGQVYILGSGLPVKMSKVLDTLIEKSTQSERIKKIEDPERLRPSDTPYMEAGDSYLKNFLNSDLIPFEKTMEDLLNYWRERI